MVPPLRIGDWQFESQRREINFKKGWPFTLTSEEDSEDDEHAKKITNELLMTPVHSIRVQTPYSEPEPIFTLHICYILQAKGNRHK